MKISAEFKAEYFHYPPTLVPDIVSQVRIYINRRCFLTVVLVGHRRSVEHIRQLTQANVAKYPQRELQKYSVKVEPNLDITEPRSVSK